MTDEPTPDVEVPKLRARYVAGIAAAKDEGWVNYHVVRLVEDEAGERYGAPTFVIADMDRDQVDHLWQHLGTALGYMDSTRSLRPLEAEREAEAEQFYDATGEHSNGAFQAGWSGGRRAGIR
jgi:hypothetical protein